MRNEINPPPYQKMKTTIPESLSPPFPRKRMHNFLLDQREQNSSAGQMVGGGILEKYFTLGAVEFDELEDIILSQYPTRPSGPDKMNFARLFPPSRIIFPLGQVMMDMQSADMGMVMILTTIPAEEDVQSIMLKMFAGRLNFSATTLRFTMSVRRRSFTISSGKSLPRWGKETKVKGR